MLSAIEDIVTRIKECYRITRDFYVDNSNLSEVLCSALLSVPDSESVAIIIDGLDMFHDVAELRGKILPTSIPSNIKLIISSADKGIINRASDVSSEIIELDRFSKEKSLEYLRVLLEQKNRCVVSEVQRELISAAVKNGTTPLQLKLIAEACSAWRSADDSVNLSDSAERIAYGHISNMYQKYGHNKELVLYALALIAASPYGVTEDELLELLLKFSPVKTYFVSEDRYSHHSNKLPFAVWSRLFYDMKSCLVFGRVKGFLVVKFAHHIFFQAFLNLHKAYFDQAVETLIEYYEKQSNYYSEKNNPNVRKALSLAVLLKRCGKTDQLTNLLCEPTYIDSVVKIGNVGEVIADLQHVINFATNSIQQRYLQRIYSCVQKNRNMLSCYHGEFYTCASDIVLTGEKPIIENEKQRWAEDLLYFPYSVDSKVSWNKKGDRYAVSNNTNVYICEEKTNAEICRIYLEPNEERRPSVARSVLWLAESIICVVTFWNDIFVFDFQTGVPKIIHTFKTCTDQCCVRYSEKNKCLFIQDRKRIRAKSVVSGEELFFIQLKHGHHVGFEVDDSNNTLSIRDSVKYIKIFDTTNGELIKRDRIKAHYSYFELVNLLKGVGIHRINESKWLLSTNTPQEALIIYNTQERSRLYLCPPYYHKKKKQLIGDKYLILVYSDALILIDLSKHYEMKWISVSNIRDVSWKIQDVVLSVLTNNGLNIVFLKDFKSFSDECSNCKVLSKNIFSSALYRAVSLKKTVDDLAFPVSLLTKLNNILDYSSLFAVVKGYAGMDISSPT